MSVRHSWSPPPRSQHPRLRVTITGAPSPIPKDSRFTEKQSRFRSENLWFSINLGFRLGLASFSAAFFNDTGCLLVFMSCYGKCNNLKTTTKLPRQTATKESPKGRRKSPLFTQKWLGNTSKLLKDRIKFDIEKFQIFVQSASLLQPER
jgi:hypothetical protein